LAEVYRLSAVLEADADVGDVETFIAAIERAQAAVDGLRDSEINVRLNVDNANLEQLANDLDGLQDREVTIRVNVDNAGVESLANQLNGLNDREVTIRVNVDNAAVENLVSQINGLRDETVTIRTDVDSAPLAALARELAAIRQNTADTVSGLDGVRQAVDDIDVSSARMGARSRGMFGLMAAGARMVGSAFSGLGHLVTSGLEEMYQAVDGTVSGFARLATGISGLISVAAGLSGITLGVTGIASAVSGLAGIIGSVGVILAGLVASTAAFTGAAVLGFGLIGAAAYRMFQGIRDGEVAFQGVTLAARSFGETFSTAFEPAAKALADLSTRAIFFAESTLPALGAAAKEAVQGMSRGFDALVNDTFPKAEESVKRIFAGLPQVVENATVAVGNLGSALTGMLAGSMPHIERVSDWIVKITDDFNKWANSVQGQQAIQRFFENLEAAMPHIAEGVQAIWRGMTNLADVDIERFAKGFESFGRGVEKVAGWIDSAADAGNRLATALNNANEKSIDFGRSIGEGAGIPEFKDSAMGKYMAELETTPERVRAVMNPLSTAYGALEAVFTKGSNAASTKEGGEGHLSPATTTIGRFLKAAGPAWEGMIEDMKPTLGKAWGDLETVFTSKGGPTAGGGGEPQGHLSPAATTIGRFIKAAQEAWPGMIDALKSNVQARWKSLEATFGGGETDGGPSGWRRKSTAGHVPASAKDHPIGQFLQDAQERWPEMISQIKENMGKNWNDLIDMLIKGERDGGGTMGAGGGLASGGAGGMDPRTHPIGKFLEEAKGAWPAAAKGIQIALQAAFKPIQTLFTETLPKMAEGAQKTGEGIGKGLDAIQKPLDKMKDLPLVRMGAGFAAIATGLQPLRGMDLEAHGKGFDKIGTGLSKLKGMDLEKMGQGFEDIGTGLGKLRLMDLEAQGKGFEKIGTGLAKLKDMDLEKMGKGFEDIGSGLGKLRGMDLEAQGQGFEEIGKGLEKLKDLDLTEMGKGFDEIGEALGELKNANLEEIGTGFDSVQESLNKLKNANLEQIGTGFDAVQQAMNKLKSAGLENIGTGLDSVQQAMNKLKSAGLENIGTGLDSIQQAINKLKSAGLEGIGTGLDSIQQAINKLKSADVPAIAQGFTELGTAMQTLGSSLTNVVTQIGELATKMDELKTKLDEVKTAFEEFVSAVEDGMQSAVDAVNTGVDSIVTAVQRLESELPPIAVAAMQAFTDAIVSGMATAAAEASAGVSAIIAALNSFVGEAHAAGVALIQGFIDGMLSMMGAAVAAAQSIGAAAAAALAAGAGVASPSWKGHDTGVQFIQGLINGMASMGDKAVQTVQGIAERIHQIVQQILADVARVPGGAGAVEGRLGGGGSGGGRTGGGGTGSGTGSSAPSEGSGTQRAVEEADKNAQKRQQSSDAKADQRQEESDSKAEKREKRREKREERAERRWNAAMERFQTMQAIPAGVDGDASFADIVASVEKRGKNQEEKMEKMLDLLDDLPPRILESMLRNLSSGSRTGDAMVQGLSRKARRRRFRGEY
jgi:phage-related protein